MVVSLLFVSRVTTVIGICRCGSDFWQRGTWVDLPEIENQVDPTISAEVQHRRRLGGKRPECIDFLLQTFVLQSKLLSALPLQRWVGKGLGPNPQAEGETERGECDGDAHRARRPLSQSWCLMMFQAIHDSLGEILGCALCRQVLQSLVQSEIFVPVCHDRPPS
jgi:hypothetical protein